MIVCKSPAEIEKMRAASALVAEVLAELAGMLAPGVSTQDLDIQAERLVRAAVRSRRSRAIALPVHSVLVDQRRVILVPVEAPLSK